MRKPKIDVFSGIGYDCNIYLIDGEVLIDAGTGHHHLIFMEWLKKCTDPMNVHTLILTHRHYDHTGGAVNIIEDTGATVYIHETDSSAIQTGDAVTTGARAFQGDQIPIDVVEINENHTFKIDIFEFQVIHTPGHTIGSISLFNEETGILFPGDVMFANGGVGRWDLATGDHDALRRSIALLADLKITDLYPGHDQPIIGKGKKHALLSLESINRPPLELMMRRLHMISK